MACTLKSKYLRIWREAVLLNPGHDSVYVPRIGMVISEWTWCAERIQIMRLAEVIEDDDHFNQAAIELLQYIRWRRRNPVKTN